MNKIFYLLIIFLSFFCYSCENENNEKSQDNLPPEIRLASPSEDIETVSGLVSISVEVIDEDSGVNKVEFYIDSLLVYTDSDLPYEYVWNTEGYEIGTQYEIKVIAYDNQSNSSTLIKIFNVDKNIVILGQTYSINSTDYFYGNDISGEIPIQLFSLINLKQLRIEGNSNLNGEIPSEIENLSKLEILYIANNDNLSGEIPPEIGTLTKLEDLTISNNNISGGIPSEIGNLENLRIIDISRNNLSGELPAFLFNSTKLTRVDLNGNQISGEITDEIITKMLQNNELRNLQMHDNLLFGVIPEELNNLQTDSEGYSMNLKYNKFCPPYPVNMDPFIFGGDRSIQNYQDCCGGGLQIENCLSDIEGNGYPTVQIGEQIWMAENLITTKYSNGDQILFAEDIDDEFVAAYSYPVYNETNYYGAIYNWYAVSDERNICPEGWHMPSDEEFKELEIFLGMLPSEADNEGFRGTDEGSKIAGASHYTMWSGALMTDEFGTSGFNALPTGPWMEVEGFIWTATEYDSLNAWSRRLFNQTSQIGRQWAPQNGRSKTSKYSCRCLKD